MWTMTGRLSPVICDSGLCLNFLNSTCGQQKQLLEDACHQTPDSLSSWYSLYQQDCRPSQQHLRAGV